MSTIRTCFQVAAFGALLVGCAAQPSTYNFEAVAPMPASGEAGNVRVRLTHAADGTPVTGATIEQIRSSTSLQLHKMPAPYATSKVVESPETVEESAGVYRIAAALPRPGDWKLAMVARVPEERAPVEGEVQVHVR